MSFGNDLQSSLMVMQLSKLKSMLIMITILCYQYVHRLILLLHICKYNFDRSLRGMLLKSSSNIEQEVDHRIQISHVKLQLYLGPFLE